MDIRKGLLVDGSEVDYRQIIIFFGFLGEESGEMTKYESHVLPRK